MKQEIKGKQIFLTVPRYRLAGGGRNVPSTGDILPIRLRASGAVLGKRMCGCGRCYNVRVTFNATGYLSTNIESLNSTRNEEGLFNATDYASYFDLKLRGSDIILATIVSDTDRNLDILETLHVESEGTYDISLTLIYDRMSSAYGLDAIQMPELNCPLCFPNRTCHIALPVSHIMIPNENKLTRRFQWTPVPRNSIDLHPNVSLVTTEENTKYVFTYGDNKWTERYFLCEECNISRALESCFKNNKVVIDGDSHLQKAAVVLEPLFSDNGWQIKADGRGVYFNEAATFGEEYLQRKLEPHFVPGLMLVGLEDGTYDQLQEQERYDTWVINTGHWDFRDITLAEYIQRVELLFEKFDRFRKKFGTKLVWNGTPPYSYNNHGWKDLEQRTNIKIALADVTIKTLCVKYNVTFVPFFELAYPFYKLSCDSHHYVCPGEFCPIGAAQLDLLLRTVCM
ncbi:uncharacterized protein [Apostichopus japonicus]|uniref:uncharacterized protein isoform X2 n=1 Tax=Stichopus japonicus TaxID=307972 RepID=UPI003AB27659